MTWNLLKDEIGDNTKQPASLGLALRAFEKTRELISRTISNGPIQYLTCQSICLWCASSMNKSNAQSFILVCKRICRPSQVKPLESHNCCNESRSSSLTSHSPSYLAILAWLASFFFCSAIAFCTSAPAASILSSHCALIFSSC